MYILSQLLVKLPKIFMGYEEITNHVLSTVFLPSNEQFFYSTEQKKKRSS
jgi:hypothetical protein